MFANNVGGGKRAGGGMGWLNVQNVPIICGIGVIQFFQIRNIQCFRSRRDALLRNYGRRSAGEQEEEKN